TRRKDGSPIWADVCGKRDADGRRRSLRAIGHSNARQARNSFLAGLRRAACIGKRVCNEPSNYSDYRRKNLRTANTESTIRATISSNSPLLSFSSPIALKASRVSPFFKYRRHGIPNRRRSQLFSY